MTDEFLTSVGRKPQERGARAAPPGGQGSRRASSPHPSRGSRDPHPPRAPRPRPGPKPTRGGSDHPDAPPDSPFWPPPLDSPAAGSSFARGAAQPTPGDPERPAPGARSPKTRMQSRRRGRRPAAGAAHARLVRGVRSGFKCPLRAAGDLRSPESAAQGPPLASTFFFTFFYFYRSEVELR